MRALIKMAKMYSCAALRVERANEGGALDADEYGQHAELARCTFDSVDSRPNTFDGGHLVMTGGRPSTPPMLPLYTRRSDLMDRDNDHAWSCDDDDAPRQRAAAVLEAEDEDEDDGDEEVEDDDGDDELAAFEALAEEDLAAAAFEAIQSRVKAAVSHLSLAACAGDLPRVPAAATPADIVLARVMKFAHASEMAIVVTAAKRPFDIVYVNHAWEDLCGFAAFETLGRNSTILHGPLTDHAAVAAFARTIEVRVARVIPSIACDAASPTASPA